MTISDPRLTDSEPPPLRRGGWSRDWLLSDPHRPRGGEWWFARERDVRHCGRPWADKGDDQRHEDDPRRVFVISIDASMALVVPRYTTKPHQDVNEAHVESAAHSAEECPRPPCILDKDGMVATDVCRVEVGLLTFSCTEVPYMVGRIRWGVGPL